MKCISKGSEVKRVSNERAEELVKTQGWFYTNKGIWKNSPHTTWTKNSTPPNPMNPNKVRRHEMKNNSYSSKTF